MRISFLLSSLWISGGVNAVIEYASAMKSRGHDVCLIFPKSTSDPETREKIHPEIRLIESKKTWVHGRNLLNLFNTAWSMARKVETSDWIVATHTPTVVPALIAAKLMGKAKAGWLYMDYEQMFDSRPVEKFLLKNAGKLFNRLWAISRACGEELSKNSGKATYLTGIGLSRTDLLYPEENMTDSKPRRIMYIGDGRPRKGLDDFLKASDIVYSHDRRIQLNIVSKSPCEITCEAPFVFHLRPSDEKLADLIRQSHLFVSASWAEGFGLPPLEAMACGTPVITTDCTGIREYARSEKNCLITPPRRPDKLAEAILRLLTDTSLQKRLRWAGLKTSAKYRWPAVIDRFEKSIIRGDARGHNFLPP